MGSVIPSKELSSMGWTVVDWTRTKFERLWAMRSTLRVSPGTCSEAAGL